MFETPKARERGSPRVVAVSVVLHALVGVAIIRILLIPLPPSRFLYHAPAPSPHVESITFVAAPVLGGAPPPPIRSSGNGKPIIGPVPPLLVAPQVTPTSVPPVPVVPKPTVPIIGDGTGPVVKAGGPASGARPEYHDPRPWAVAGTGGGPAQTGPQAMDSLARVIVQAHNDSLGPPHKQPGDWTTNINGQKWGVDQKFIHLGPVEIPTAVLAILPLNVTANPIDNDRTINANKAAIDEQANRGRNEEDMNKAIKEERLRLQKQHDDAKKLQQQQQQQQKTDQAGTPIAAKDGSN
jgi:hypothetical protein